MIGFQPPRNRAAGADHAVLGDRDEEDDFDHRRTHHSGARYTGMTLEVLITGKCRVHAASNVRLVTDVRAECASAINLMAIDGGIR